MFKVSDKLEIMKINTRGQCFLKIIQVTFWYFLLNNQNYIYLYSQLYYKNVTYFNVIITALLFEKIYLVKFDTLWKFSDVFITKIIIKFTLNWILINVFNHFLNDCFDYKKCYSVTKTMKSIILLLFAINSIEFLAYGNQDYRKISNKLKSLS